MGVCGPVIELLECDERFFTAVEVTAGNRYICTLPFMEFVLQKLCSVCLKAKSFTCYQCYELTSFVMNSLFHVVVDSDETATTIIRHLTALKGGRVTFIPLNKVKPPYVNCPQSDDVVPLLKKLKFQEIYTKAFAQVSVAYFIYFYILFWYFKLICLCLLPYK